MFRTWAPTTTAAAAFVTGAATGSAAVPALFPTATNDLTTVLVIVCGLVWIPVGVAIGERLRG